MCERERGGGGRGREEEGKREGEKCESEPVCEKTTN